MSFFLVTMNRFDRMRESLRKDNALKAAQIRGMQETIEDMARQLDASKRLADSLTQLIQKDDVRKRGVQIANSEIIIWKVNQDGKNEPPMVRNTIAGFWEQYNGLRPEDLGDLLPGMIGISILPRTDAAATDALRAAERVYHRRIDPPMDETTVDRIPIVMHEPKAIKNDSEHPSDHADGQSTG